MFTTYFDVIARSWASKDSILAGCEHSDRGNLIRKTKVNRGDWRVASLLAMTSFLLAVLLAIPAFSVEIPLDGVKIPVMETLGLERTQAVFMRAVTNEAGRRIETMTSRGLLG